MKRKLICVLLSAILLLSLVPALHLQALAASEMKASDECIELLKRMEGFSAKPYWDYSQYSVGYGTACPSEEDRLRYEEEGIRGGSGNASAAICGNLRELPESKDH